MPLLLEQKKNVLVRSEVEKKEKKNNKKGRQDVSDARYEYESEVILRI